MRVLALILLFISVVESSLVTTVLNKVEWPELVGVNAQFPEFWNASVTTKQLGPYRALGLKWLRLSIHWYFLEHTEGNFAWSIYDPPIKVAEEAGCKAIINFVGTPPWISKCGTNTVTDSCPPTNYTTFATRLVTLAQRYTWVDYWEVWNEMNLPPVFWYPSYDPDTYADLFKEVARVFAIHGLQSKLAVGAFAYYGGTPTGTSIFTDLGSRGAYASKPVISFHPYTNEPEGYDNEDVNDIYSFTSTSNYLIGLASQNYGVSNVWATEWGWSSYPGPVSEQPIIGEIGQADHTVKRLLLHTITGYNKTFLFTITDLDERALGLRDQFYGLIRLNGTAKPVYNYMSAFFKVVGESSSPMKPLSPNNIPKDWIGVTFERNDGKKLCAFYLQNSTSPSTVIVFNLTTPALLHDIATGKSVAVNSDGQQVQVTATYGLQILEWPYEIPTTQSDISGATSQVSQSGSASGTRTNPVAGGSERSYRIEVFLLICTFVSML